MSERGFRSIPEFADTYIPRHHPSDVRFYLGLILVVALCLILLGEVVYALLGGCTNLQATLDDFGLFDAALFGVIGAVVGFYFSERRNG